MRRAWVLVLCIVCAGSACSPPVPPPGADAKDPGTPPLTRSALLDSGYRVRWDHHDVPATVPAKGDLDVRLSFTNVSDQTWPDPVSGDPQKRDGSYAVRLAYQWLAAGDDEARFPALRAELPRPVKPGETISILVKVPTPPQPGEYRLAFELVQERVAWFALKGATKLVVPVRVI